MLAMVNQSHPTEVEFIQYILLLVILYKKYRILKRRSNDNRSNCVEVSGLCAEKGWKDVWVSATVSLWMEGWKKNGIRPLCLEDFESPSPRVYRRRRG